MTDDELITVLPSALADIERAAPVPDDLADRLLAALYQPPARAARPSRRRWLLPGLSAALVVAVVIGLVLGGVLDLGRKQHARPAAAPSGQATSWHTYQGVRFPVPRGWQALPATFATAALDQPLGYITDQPTGPECTPAGCGPPLRNRTVGPGGILVSITTGAIFVDPSQHPWANVTVAGFPAHRDDDACHGRCGPTGTQHIQVEIDLGKTGDNTQPTGLILYVVIGPHGEQTLHEFDTMLAHASYR